MEVVTDSPGSHSLSVAPEQWKAAQIRDVVRPGLVQQDHQRDITEHVSEHLGAATLWKASRGDLP